MALYSVYNLKATPGATEQALIVTNGAKKARVVFAERFGGELDSILSERVGTSGDDGRVVGAWQSDSEAEQELAAGGADTLAEADGEA
jgi:hypothetical protein